MNKLEVKINKCQKKIQRIIEKHVDVDAGTIMNIYVHVWNKKQQYR